MNSKLPNNRIVGAKQTVKAVKSGTVKTVYVADDAEQKVIKPIIELCNHNNVEVVHVTTMQRLGELCSIDVGAATACITKD